MSTGPRGMKIGSLDRIRPALSRGREAEERAMWRGMGDAWTAMSTIISGIVVWGGIGYGLDRLLGTRPVLFAIGAMVGNFAAVFLVYKKSMKQDAPTGAPSKQDAPTGAPSKRGGA